MITLKPDWKFKETFPKISAYTTLYNGIKGTYPFELAVRSFAWVDELVVVDGGSDDGTREKLEELKKDLSNLRVYDIPIDWECPGKDGQQKAMARAMCSSEYLIQFDCDELCCGEPVLWKRMAKHMSEEVDILQLFVAEPFGSLDNVRLNKEHNPLKWRIYRNKAEITHGIPAQDRVEVDGKVYSKGGSDGCFPIHIVTNQLYPSYASTKKLMTAKDLVTLKGDDVSVDYYKETVNEIMETQPYVLHLGHVDLKSKINLYLNNWHKWWCHLYNKDVEDPENNLYFPGVKISDVTDQMIEEKVIELKSSTPVAAGFIPKQRQRTRLGSMKSLP